MPEPATRWPATDGAEVLCLGVGWAGRTPLLQVLTGEGPGSVVQRIPLLARDLAWSATSDRRWCTGIPGGPGAAHLPCPDQNPATGRQCPQCAGRDVFRFVHQAHRGGYTPPALSEYLSRPQWLYVATFGDGTTKVGTAIEERGWTRLDEQGPPAATQVAVAPDGRVVRVLEELISTALPLGQSVHRSRKLAGVLQPLPRRVLLHEHDLAVRSVSDLLRGVPLDPRVQLVEREWTPPAAASALLAQMQDPARPPVAYPHDPSLGRHGLHVIGALGPIALAHLPGDPQRSPFVVDLGALRGRRLTLGEFTSPTTSFQTSLF